MNGALLFAFVLSASAGPSHSVERGSIAFKVVHAFHKVTGTSTAVEGKVRVLDAGKVQLMLRAKVETFDSGNNNRDAHMLEVIEAGRFPWVELKGVADGLVVPATTPAEVKLPIRALLTFHGVTQPVALDARLRFESPSQVRATAEFPISLAAFQIDRPALLYLRVDDRVNISVDLSFRQEH